MGIERFSNAEVEKIWEMQDKEWVDAVLVLLYTGFRISELLDIKAENVDLSLGTIKFDTKSKDGKEIIEIHPRIESIIRKRLNEGGEYLFSYEGSKCSDAQYRLLWNQIMKDAGMTHTPHECRHTHLIAKRIGMAYLDNAS